MRWFLPLLLLLLAACGGSDGGPNDPGDVVETPEPLDFSYLNRLPQPDDLSSVSEFEGRVIAVGNGGALVVREPGESAWRRIPSPTREAFRAVVMVDAQTILATTSAGIWLSRDGATSWKLVDTTHHMRSIAVRNGRAVIGGLFGVVASSDFESWEPAVDSPTDVIDVGFAGDSFVWVMSATEMHRSVDGGKNWVRMIESGVGGTFVAFAFADEDFGTLALANREIKGTTNGSTFTLVREVVTPVVDVDFDSTGRGVLVTRGLDVYTSDSQGKAWTFEGGVDAEQTAASITSTTDGEVLVVGLEGLIVESSGGLSTLDGNLIGIRRRSAWRGLRQLP